MKYSGFGHKIIWKNGALENGMLYRSIYDSIMIAIFIVTDQNGRIVKWNKGAEHAFGFTEEEMLGRDYSFILRKEYVKTDFLDFVASVKLNKEGCNQESYILHGVHSTGRVFPVELIIRKLDFPGKDLYILKMLDITKRIAFQDKLRHKTEELELFLYRSAHDLNAPFSSAQGLIDLMKGEESLEILQSLIAKLENTLDSARVLSDRLAGASLVSQRNQPASRIDFPKLVDNVVTMHKVRPAAKNMKFQIEVQDIHGFVSNPELIHAIFQNLVQNAIQYSRPPSEEHKPFIDVRVLATGDELEIMVCDNGKGIRKKDRNRIFDMYFRARAEETQSSNGMGLYIVKRIVESLNGHIHVESRINVGTCFRILIPRVNDKH